MAPLRQRFTAPPLGCRWAVCADRLTVPVSAEHLSNPCHFPIPFDPASYWEPTFVLTGHQRLLALNLPLQRTDAIGFA